MEEIRYGGRASGKEEANNKWLCSHEPGCITKVQCDTNYKPAVKSIMYDTSTGNTYFDGRLVHKTHISSVKPWEINNDLINKFLNIRVKLAYIAR